MIYFQLYEYTPYYVGIPQFNQGRRTHWKDFGGRITTFAACKKPVA
ncbi:MAG: RsiV family protein [Firmicutes bacterium]|nr:RsiV family protein [Bacillota bacterium]